MAGNSSVEGRGTAVKSLQTAFRILDAVDQLEHPTVTRIARDVDVAKSTVFDHLKTLEDADFVVKSSDATYRIGLRFLSYGGRARWNMELYRVAKPELEKVAHETGELVNLVVEEHGMGVYLDYVEGTNAVALDTYVGKREHLHSTAFGKAILAHLPASRVDAIVEQHGLASRTDKTLSDREILEERLAQVRERGYAVDEEERLERLQCVASPILSETGNILGAVSISGASQRFRNEQLFEELVETVMQAVNIIEVNITYSK